VRFAVAAAAAVAALALPGAASAHASLRGSTPQDGAVLAHAPRSVQVVFDDVVHVGSRNAAVANATGTSVLAGKPTADLDVLAIPLRPGLPRGAYSVRWSIVSNDGHLERGVLAFAVGPGEPRPRSVLGAAVPLTWTDLVLRTLYYLGLLASGGIVLFALAVRGIIGRALERPVAQVVFFGLLAVFVGGSGIVHTAAPGTRYVLVVKVALVLALAAGSAAALAPMRPVLLPVAGAVSLALLAAPTLAGHALDPSEPRFLAVPADLLHIASAAAWVGVLLGLAVVVPRTGAAAATRERATRRASGLALAAVALLAASGVARAAMELSAVSQLWSTSYGRTILVKSALFLALLALGSVSRRRQRLVRFELVLIAAVVVAVAVLTELRPGSERPYEPSATSLSRDRLASSLIVSRKHGASSKAASPLGRSCPRLGRRDLRRTVAMAPAAPITPPMANDRSLPRRSVSSMRRSYSCG
jgi:copper transport protein